MKTFIVKGQNWHSRVKIPKGKFDKYGDAAFEAMTQGIEKFFNDEHEVDDYARHAGLGWVTLAYEEGCEDDPEKQIASLTEYALINAGYHKLAAEAKKIRQQEDESEDGF